MQSDSPNQEAPVGRPDREAGTRSSPPGQAPAPKAKRKLSLKKRAAFAAILLLGSLAIVVLIGEAYFRIQQNAVGARLSHLLGIAKDSVVSWPIYDPDLIYRNRPNWEDHNSDGMRDHPTPPKTRFRLLMLGDSIGYHGESIDDTYPGRLETLLNEDSTSAGADVLNAGTRGYTNYQELLYLKKFGLQFEPDSVGLGFCVNDLHRFLHGFDVVDGEIAAKTYQFSEDAARALAPGILHPSLFLSWFWTKAHAATIHFGWREGFIFDYRPDVCTAWQDEPWTEIEVQVTEMAELCRQKGASFFVVSFPYAYQYLEEYLDKDRDYVLKPQARLREICRKLGVPFLDLYDQLSNDGFIEDGIHLTADGRTKTSAAIAAFLKTNRILPAATPK
ncbi:MAG: SGNH/GDSL hydrolase family protein [Planctomycetota bacterium]|jgi:lysophospholipase L1-like esterase